MAYTITRYTESWYKVTKLHECVRHTESTFKAPREYAAQFITRRRGPPDFEHAEEYPQGAGSSWKTQAQEWRENSRETQADTARLGK